jgi:phage baseplate assembly protein W
MNIDFPFQFDSTGRTAGTDDADHVRDMIEQFLLTSSGERVNRADFGGDLLQSLFAPNSPEIANMLEARARAGLNRWLGDLIDVRTLSFTAVDSLLSVELTYSIKATGEQRSDVIAVQRASP